MNYALKKEDEEFLLHCGLGLKVMKDGRLYNENRELHILGLERKYGDLVQVRLGEFLHVDDFSIQQCMKLLGDESACVVNRLKKEISDIHDFMSLIGSIDFEGR